MIVAWRDHVEMLCVVCLGPVGRQTADKIMAAPCACFIKCLQTEGSILQSAWRIAIGLEANDCLGSGAESLTRSKSGMHYLR